MCVRASPPQLATAGRAMLRCVALALLCVSLAHADTDKRAEMSPVPFVMGSRYGRSPERVMAPRNDRFFMGSRYGKRSESPLQTLSGRGMRGVCTGREEGCIVCEYTGVLTLFKCVSTRTHINMQIARRSADDSGPGEEV